MTTTGNEPQESPDVEGDGKTPPPTEQLQEGPPPTPFDHPFFLPVILIALTLWFGYDGFINTDPEMQEHLTFNRVGFGILLLLSVWFGYKAIQENDEIKRQDADRASRDNDSAR